MPLCVPRVLGASLLGETMAVIVQREIEFPMVDLAQIAFYPRIYDLAHRCFEQAWALMCEQTYPHIINEMRLGFPVVHINSEFHAPIKYGDCVSMEMNISHLGTRSLEWQYRLTNQHGILVWSSTQMTVCVDMETMQSKDIPESLRRGLSNHLSG